MPEYRNPLQEILSAVPAPITEQPITVYFTGDEEGPDRFGLVYDTEDEAFEAAHENELEVWRVNVVPDWEHATHLVPDTKHEDLPISVRPTWLDGKGF